MLSEIDFASTAGIFVNVVFCTGFHSYFWVGMGTPGILSSMSNKAEPSAILIKLQEKKQRLCSNMERPALKLQHQPSLHLSAKCCSCQPLGTNCSPVQGKCICLFHQHTYSPHTHTLPTPHWSTSKHMGGDGRVLPHAAHIQRGKYYPLTLTLSVHTEGGANGSDTEDAL